MRRPQLGIPFPETFAPLPSQEETGMTVDAKWMLPPSMKALEARTFGLQILSLAEVGNTVSADHLLQMATMPLEHKTTALGIPYHHSVSYLFDGIDVLTQSLHSLFGLVATGNTPRYCPQASQFGKDLCIAARTDSAHIISIALSMASALQTGRSTLALCEPSLQQPHAYAKKCIAPLDVPQVLSALCASPPLTRVHPC